jgi:hypothetical protein
MAAPLKQVSIIPDLPRSQNVVDREGNLAPDWKLFFEQLIQALQTNLKPEGILFPQQTAANIALLTGIGSLGNILYDSTNNVFKGNVLTAPNTFTWKTFTLV